MRGGKRLKPINLVMGCSGAMLALSVVAWVTSRAIGLPQLHGVGTTLFFIGVVVAFLPFLGVLVGMCVERLGGWWKRTK